MIITDYVNPPIPTRDCDWAAWFDWDDGGERMCGRGATEDSAVLDLLRQAVEADGDGSEQEEVIDLAFEGWAATKGKDT